MERGRLAIDEGIDDTTPVGDSIGKRVGVGLVCGDVWAEGMEEEEDEDYYYYYYYYYYLW